MGTCRMENDAFWRMEDQKSKRNMIGCGSGTLGVGMLGSCNMDHLSHSALGTVSGNHSLHRTTSMPTLGPPPPCGRRVGEDLGLSEAGSVPPTPLLRRKAKMPGALECRLTFLEGSFPGKRGKRGDLSSVALQSYSSKGPLSQGRLSTAGSQGRLSTAGSMRSEAACSVASSRMKTPSVYCEERLSIGSRPMSTSSRLLTPYS